MNMNEIQEKLRCLGLYTGAIDDTFGPLTKNATGKFQTEFSGLYTGKIDGIPGPLTQAALTKAFAAAAVHKSTGAQLSEHFNENEFVCHDGSGLVAVDPRLVLKLELLREALGSKPITVTSGYRTPAYNATLPGAARDSQHTVGKAADVVVPGYTPAQVAAKAAQVGFDGIGVYQGFTHCDTRGYSARWNG